MADKTKKPTGLKITRNGNKFKLNWKIADKDYADGQSFGYAFDTEKGNTINRLVGSTPTHSVSIGTKATSHTLTIDKSKYYPTTTKKLLEVHMAVRGNRKKYTSSGKTISPTVSDWSMKSYTVNAPHKPKLTATRDSTVENKVKFTWTTENDDDSHWFTNTEWQTKLFPESSVTKGANLNWSGAEKGTSTANNSKTVTEQTEIIAEKSYTRWLRIRSRGPAGASDWVYAKHIYATPQTAVIDSENTWYADNGANGYICYVQFTANSTNAYPIDKATIQYTITTPSEDMQCPDGVSWTDARNVKSTGTLDAVSFSIDSQIGYDQCLYVRVNTQHDIESNVTYGAPVLVNGGVGELSAPSGINVVADDTTYRATITATNNSSVPDSFLVIVYRASDNYENENVVGYIEHGETSVTVQAPDWSGADDYAFGVYAAVGDVPITRDSALMKSAIVWKGGEVPKAPTNVSVNPTSVTGTVQVTWDWNWQNADGSELSWSDHEDAWESTDEPDTYEISNTKTGRWNISGLETGITWYIRVRFKKGIGDNATYGAYSDIQEIDLSSAPAIPTLVLSDEVIPQDGEVTASWIYSTTDGTAQAYAEVVEATITAQGISYSDPIASVSTEQQVTLNAEEMGWTVGNTYNLCVRVVSASGRISDDYSDPVSVTIAEPPTIEILSTSLVQQTIQDNPTGTDPDAIAKDTDADTGTSQTSTDSRSVLSLTTLPLELELSSDDVTVAIERAESYPMDRPDETTFDGYEGETIALKTGDVDEITFDDLIGSLDDGAKYRLVVTVSDDLGQRAETSLDFEVHWQYQAIEPLGTVQIDQENYIATITPTAPQGARQDDVCDIYRLSIDRPELVVYGAQFGTPYVDPYPAIGQFGGYRLVTRTPNGDYTTEDNHIAWLDIREELVSDYSIIDFDGGQILLQYGVSNSSDWSKDFLETKYLGGSVQGDWNPAVSKSTRLDASVITITDQDSIEALHRLSVTPTACHVRTSDGASFTADVQVSESNNSDKYGKITGYSLNITRIDPQGLDGMSKADWDDLHNEEP